MRRPVLLLLIVSYFISTTMSISQEDVEFSSLLTEFLLNKRKFCEHYVKQQDYPMEDHGKRCKWPCGKGSASPSSAEIESGPFFWANRGKKDPTYIQSRLFVDEPRWYVTRKDAGGLAYDPFFITRGKKTVTEVKDYVTLGKIEPEKKI